MGELVDVGCGHPMPRNRNYVVAFMSSNNNGAELIETRPHSNGNSLRYCQRFGNRHSSINIHKIKSISAILAETEDCSLGMLSGRIAIAYFFGHYAFQPPILITLVLARITP
ncbi:hypothetical protein AVEN_89827-1 [Araneus ventricosus]|uniref:Uncharacterized protein n=1 Tax=Araneus ventricosus TaxID=182803 RepID=A0A4Y2RUR1_ARAVE|nr:hypothetical protein AVEN_89827-1 [Araneus ventricosus]